MLKTNTKIAKKPTQVPAIVKKPTQVPATVKKPTQVPATAASKKDSLLKDILLKDKLLGFFTPKRLTIVADVLEKKTSYSLRIVEWFISNYAKRHNTVYPVRNQPFNVYSSYKNGQLKSFSKKQFDLFRRSKRFMMQISPQRSIETTVAQLNFFKWAIDNGVLTYVENNFDKIKKDMDASLKSRKKKVVKTSQNIIITRKSIVIHFD
jgi:hypothetical protein